MDSIRSFKSTYRSLSNIYKFANEPALSILQDYLKRLWLFDIVLFDSIININE